MDTVRNFLLRLASISPEARPTFRHRRLVVPAAAEIALDGTIIRTTPMGRMKRPGNPVETVQVLEWLDIAANADGVDLRENDLAADLVAILALAIGRRVMFVNEVPISLPDKQATWFFEVGQVFDSELYAPVLVDSKSKFEKVLKALSACSEAELSSMGGAIRMWNAACCLVDSDHSSAYGLLIAAVETLSRVFGDPPESWEDWEEAEGWDKLFKRLSLAGNSADMIRAKLMRNKQIRLKRTFVEYVVSSLPDSFWQASYSQYTQGFRVESSQVQNESGAWDNTIPMETIVPRDGTELRSRLTASYSGLPEA